MNVPNQLTLARIAAIPFYLALLYGGAAGGSMSLDAMLYGAAFLLAVMVCITDWLDGIIARERNLVTNFGKLADPLADKVFVTAALVAFADLGLIPGWVVIVVIAREFLVTGIRQLALERGETIAADKLGKHKTAWQLALVLIGNLLLAADAVSGGAALVSATGQALLQIPLWTMLVLTVLSGANYTWKGRSLINMK